MKVSVRRSVRERSRHRCEYCHIPDFALEREQLHVEHVIAKQHGGSDDPDNLAWCCSRCNAKKGPNLSSVDPLTGEIVRLFNPRTQPWNRHFQWIGDALLGRTRIGRATISLFQMNESHRVVLRKQLREREHWVDPE
ncbi:HNH endonuclease signature motif containing protein [soil metagenome]